MIKSKFIIKDLITGKYISNKNFQIKIFYSFVECNKFIEKRSLKAINFELVPIK